MTDDPTRGPGDDARPAAADTSGPTQDGPVDETAATSDPSPRDDGSDAGDTPAGDGTPAGGDRTPATTAPDGAASGGDPAGAATPGWTKSPSIWPEPIKPARRPDLWSPEARRTGPIATTTPPLAADATSAADQEPTDANQDPTDPAPVDAAQDSTDPTAPEPAVAAEGPAAAAEDPAAAAQDPVETVPGEGSGEAATPGQAGDALSYTGIFKAITDDDVDPDTDGAAADGVDADGAAAAAGDAGGDPAETTQPASDPVEDAETAAPVGAATAPFHVPSEFTPGAPEDDEDTGAHVPHSIIAPAAGGAAAAAAAGGAAGAAGGGSNAASGAAAAEPGATTGMSIAGATPAGGSGDGGSGDGGSGDGGAADGGSGDGSGDTDRRGGRRVAIVAGAVVAVLAVGYGVAYAVAGDSLARGATVAGVDVGGMTRDEAAATLTDQLPAIADAPIAVTVDGDDATYELVPSSIGLGVDVDATIDRVPGASANPVSLVRALIGSGATTPSVTVDDTALEAAVADIASQSDLEPVNGSVAFDGGEVVTSDPVAGRALDTDAAVVALTEAFFGEGTDAEAPTSAVTFPAADVAPAVGAEDVETAVADFAEPAMSGPVTVVADDESVDLSPAVIGPALTMQPDDAGVLQPVVDPEALAAGARDELEELGQEGQDATVVIEGGKPVVVEAEAGLGIAPEALSEAILPVLSLAGDERQVEVELTESDPEVTTAAAEELGITEVVAEFTTEFPAARYRDVNIGTAAERMDNTLLLPDEEFSLNNVVGERTEANGFTNGTIIDGGRLREDMGGGVSQVATTAFHAAFQAGLEDVEHWPHSIYFDRYPIGQEATVAWGSKDMRFRNDTPYGVLVDTSFTASQGRGSGSLTVRIWSTKHYEVETSVGDRYAHTSPQTIHDTGGNCQAQGGSGGFSIDSFRTVTLLDGTVDKDEHTSWTYNPNHRVVCGPEPDDD